MKKHHFNRSKLKELIDYDDYLIMESLYINKSKFPEYARPDLSFNYKKKHKANLLTQLVVDYLKFNNYFVERTSNTGLYRADIKKYTKGSGMNGTSDLKAVINGNMYAIEIKFGKDKQSEAQKIYQRKIKAAGGKYIIVRNITDLKNGLK